MRNDEADIRSEAQVALADEMTERVAFLPKKKLDIIVLRTRRRNYPIRVEKFAVYSEKIATLAQRGEVPPAIDLSCYHIGAVRTLTDFIAGVDQRNLRLGDNILSDLLQLARIFRMRQLTSLIIQHIIEKVEKGPPSNLLLALNLVSSDWSMFLQINETSAMVETAAENINEVTTSTFFNMLPAAVLVMLYSRCDVNILSELELSERLIRWLKKMVRTDDDAEVLFSCVRTPFLSAKDRNVIQQKCSGLPRSMIDVIERTLDSPRNHRCCVIREHIERRYRRCGIPDGRNFLKINAINVTSRPIADKEKSEKTGSQSLPTQGLAASAGTARTNNAIEVVNVSPTEITKASGKEEKRAQESRLQQQPKDDAADNKRKRRIRSKTYESNEDVDAAFS